MEKIEIKLKDCCLMCENIEPDGLYGMSLHPNREISCRHMQVCKRYLEETGKGKSEGPDMEEIRKKVTIRNTAGVLQVEIEREINLRDAMYGFGEDKLPPLTHPRLEFHRRKDGNMLVTLFDQTNEFPSHIYLFFVNGDEIKAYIGCVNSEEEEDTDFVTWKV